MTSTLYVLDEPTIGLHPRDTGLLLAILRKLAQRGNTVVVVEHDPDVIAAADRVIDLGPEAGARGGELLFAGTPAGIRRLTHNKTAEAIRRRRGPLGRRPGRVVSPRRRGGDHDRQRARAQSPKRDGPHSARTPRLRHGRLGLGKIDAPAQLLLQRLPAEGQGGRERRRRPGRRDPRARERGRSAVRRPEPPGPVGAVESRDLHESVRGGSRAAREDREGPRVSRRRARFLLQHVRRPLRGLPGNGRPHDRHAVPGGRGRDVRPVRRPPLQPEGPRRAVPREERGRRSPDDGRGSALVFRRRPEDRPAPRAARGGGTLVPAARPADGDAFRRRSPAPEARVLSRGENLSPREPLPLRRTDDRPPFERRRSPASHAAPADLARAFGRRDRAPSRLHRGVGLGHRPRAGRGRPGGRDRGRRAAVRAAEVPPQRDRRYLAERAGEIAPPGSAGTVAPG